jgi:phage baseplate assembly protein gpV
MNKNFAGLNGFIWWIGVIENRVDPLALGRCQVRIFGWHNENSVTLPTSDLPWAQAMIPINDSKHFSAPRVGEWVVGFFMDGEQAQTPVMMGVLPGLKP